MNPLLETNSCTLFTHSCISLSACGRDFACIHREKSSTNNEAYELFKTDFTIIIVNFMTKKVWRQDATLRNTHLLLIRSRQSGTSSHLEQYTAFPCGVVSFFQIKENGNNVLFFFVFFCKSFTFVAIKTNQVIRSASVFFSPENRAVQRLTYLWILRPTSICCSPSCPSFCIGNWLRRWVGSS